jgi:uncharacterized protein YukE
MAKRTVEVLLKAKDQTKKATDSAAKGFGGLEKTILKNTVSIAALGIATVAMGHKLVTAWKEGAEAAREFESAVAEVNTLLNADKETVNKLSADLQNLAVKFGQTDTVMAKAQYNVVSAGFTDISDSMMILEISSKAAIGGISDVNTAARVITQTLNAYGKEASDATHVADLLFAQKGVIAEETFTAINALIVALGAASGEQKAKLEAVGITLEYGLAPALAAIDAAGGGALDVLAELVPNIRAIKAAAAAGQDGASGLIEQLEKMHAVAGDMDTAYRIMADTIKQQAAVAEAASQRYKEALGRRGMAGELLYLKEQTKALGERTADLEKYGDGVEELARNWAQLRIQGEAILTIVTRLGLKMTEGRKPGFYDDYLYGQGQTGKGPLIPDFTSSDVPLGPVVAGAWKSTADDPEVVASATSAAQDVALIYSASASDALEAIAESLGVGTTETIFDPIFGQMVDVPLKFEDLARAVADAWNRGLEDSDFIGPVANVQQEVDSLSAGMEAAEIAANGLGRGVGSILVDSPFKIMSGQAVDFAKVMQTTVMSVLQSVLKQLLLIKTVGFFGNALGLNQGGTIPGDLGNIGPVFALGGTIPKAAYGFSVPDGIRGRDSRLIYAQPGEEVINRGLSRRLNRFITAQESAAYASPYGSGGTSGGGNTVLLNVGIPDSMAGLQRMTDGIVERLSEGGEI